MIRYWHMDAVRCKLTFLTVSAVVFFLPPLFLFLPLPHILSFVFILGKVVCGGETVSFVSEEKID